MKNKIAYICIFLAMLSLLLIFFCAGVSVGKCATDLERESDAVACNTHDIQEETRNLQQTYIYDKYPVKALCSGCYECTGSYTGERYVVMNAYPKSFIQVVEVGQFPVYIDENVSGIEIYFNGCEQATEFKEEFVYVRRCDEDDM